MKSSRLVLLAALAIGCVTTAAKPAPHFRATGLMSAFEGKTLYQCTASTGTQIAFARGKIFVSVLSSGGTIWVRPRSTPDGTGAAITTPVPSANALADGWILLHDGEVASWGVDAASTAGLETSGAAGSVDQIGALDVWCQAQGDVVANAH